MASMYTVSAPLQLFIVQHMKDKVHGNNLCHEDDLKESIEKFLVSPVDM